MEQLGADLVVPIVFHARITPWLILGPKRSGAPTRRKTCGPAAAGDQSAVALETAERTRAPGGLRRVEILESVRASFSKSSSPRVESHRGSAGRAGPRQARRDVSVLFVDIAGYTRLSERSTASGSTGGRALLRAFSTRSCSTAATSTRRPRTGSWSSSRTRANHATPRPPC